MGDLDPFKVLLGSGNVTQPFTATAAGHSVELAGGKANIVLADGTDGPVDVLICDSSDPPQHLITLNISRYVAPGNSIEIDLTRMEWL